MSDAILKTYLGMLENFCIKPNFFCSFEYLVSAGVKIESREKNWFITLDGKTLFPGIPKHDGSNYMIDFDSVGGRTFFDNEYIYDPKDYYDLNGGKWAIFRKNINHFKKFYSDYTYHQLKEYSYVPYGIICDWMSLYKRDVQFYDFETLENYIRLFPFNVYMLSNSDCVMGINIVDENYLYTNFRWTFASDITIRGLSEYLRLCMMLKANPDKLVNDGGDLGIEGIKIYKERMNPVKINKRYSF